MSAAPALRRYDKEGEPAYASARLWDDGVIRPQVRASAGAAAAGRRGPAWACFVLGAGSSGRRAEPSAGRGRRPPTRPPNNLGAPAQDTRAVLGLSLAAALNRPLGDSRFGVFRM